MLYKFNKENAEKCERIKIHTPSSLGIKEKDIENFLYPRLYEIFSEDHLMPIAQQRRMQEEADLLALDKDGNLFIFELKRWESEPNNLLQVMKYGQKFGRYSYDKLAEFVENQNSFGGLTLQNAHKEYFELTKSLDESEFNRDQTFVLVTHGTDSETISAIDFWSKKGLKIKSAPYRIYQIEEQPYIQFEKFNPEGDVITEENINSFIVNTNKTWNETAWKDMLNDLQKGEASAYYDRKYGICNITQGSTVYLYHTEVGVIAKGKTIKNYEIRDIGDDKNEEYFVQLKFDWAIPEARWKDEAIAPWEINAALNSGHRFRQTVFSVSESMQRAIDKIHEEKQQSKIE